MDRYSAANALLIFNQLPEATQLKDFDDWGKDNVKIVKGAKSISILEPVEYARQDGTTGISYNVKKMFDVSQTNGRQTPAVSVNRDPKALITTMLDACPVEVEATNELPYPNMAAFYNNEKQTLYVKRNVGDSVAVAQCVAQELGHAQLSINSDTYSRRDMGFQAVCIGYMLCKKYGVDTQNFAIDRIPESLKEKEPKEIRAELSKTRNAMSEINSRISEELYRKKQERSKEHEASVWNLKPMKDFALSTTSIVWVKKVLTTSILRKHEKRDTASKTMCVLIQWNLKRTTSKWETVMEGSFSCVSMLPISKTVW